MTTKHSVTRRTALAGAAAGSLIPVAGLAQAATTPNATDAAWADYAAAYRLIRSYDRAPELISDDDMDALGDRHWAAHKAVLAAPVATLADLQRKVICIADQGADSMIEHDWIAQLLDQIEEATGRSA